METSARWKKHPTGGAHLSVARRSGVGLAGARKLAGLRVRETDGPAVERFWAVGKKRKRDGVGPARLKWLRGKRNVLHFLETTQAHSIQIRIQEFKFKLNPNKKNNAVRLECNTKEQPYLI